MCVGEARAAAGASARARGGGPADASRARRRRATRAARAGPAGAADGGCGARDLPGAARAPLVARTARRARAAPQVSLVRSRAGSRGVSADCARVLQRPLRVGVAERRRRVVRVAAGAARAEEGSRRERAGACGRAPAALRATRDLRSIYREVKLSKAIKLLPYASVSVPVRRQAVILMVISSSTDRI